MATMDTGQTMVTRIAVEDLGSHLATLEVELSDGRAIELVRGERVIAEIRARHRLNADGRQRFPLPDFMARLRANFPDGPVDIDMTAAIREDRDARG